MKKSNHSNKPNNSKGEVRIIAGLWRGRKLPVLSAEGLRPTGDRVKETLFNWLMPYVADSRCLDAFAGSGSLGFEALSRQARHVVFLEMDRAVAAQLNKNIQSIQCAERAQVVNQNSLQFLAQNPNGQQFDLVFLDPPFHFGLAQQAIDLLTEQNWLAPRALVYVETEKGQEVRLPATWQLLKDKTTGQVSYRLYQAP